MLADFHIKRLFNTETTSPNGTSVSNSVISSGGSECTSSETKEGAPAGYDIYFYSLQYLQFCFVFFNFCVDNFTVICNIEH